MGCPALEGFDKMAESLATMATIDERPLPHPSPIALQPSTVPPYVNDKMRIPLHPSAAHRTSTPYRERRKTPQVITAVSLSVPLTYPYISPSLSLSLQT